MTINSLTHRYDKKQLWYLATVCGFTIGWATGWAIILCVQSLPWRELLFWAIPAGGAGLGMGLGQWTLIRRIHKNAYLWIPATTIGVIATIGGTLLLTLIINAFFKGSLSAFFTQFADWFIPWLVLLTVIAPMAIIIGPFCQWLIVRDVVGGQPSKEILKMSAGWILTILLLVIMLLFTGTIFHSRNIIINLLIFGVSAIPSGLIFAQATIAANHTG